MAKKIKLLITFVAMLLSYPMANASSDYVVNVTETDEPFHMDEPPVRHRSLSKIRTCIITSQGILILNSSSEEYCKFEVYSQAGECLGSFTDERDFSEFVHRASGTIEIRLYSDTSLLSGQLTI
jgi:hypothetical protein